MATSCPKCRADLDLHADVTLYGLVPAERDPEGKARADLILECGKCERRWNAFVALEDFFENPIVEGA